MISEPGRNRLGTARLLTVSTIRGARDGNRLHGAHAVAAWPRHAVAARGRRQPPWLAECLLGDFFGRNIDHQPRSNAYSTS